MSVASMLTLYCRCRNQCITKIENIRNKKKRIKKTISGFSLSFIKLLFNKSPRNVTTATGEVNVQPLCSLIEAFGMDMYAARLGTPRHGG